MNQNNISNQIQQSKNSINLLKRIIRKTSGIISVTLEPTNSIEQNKLIENNVNLDAHIEKFYELRINSKKIPNKWIRFSYKFELDNPGTEIKLLLAFDEEFSVVETKTLPFINSVENSINVFIPENVKKLALKFPSNPGNIEIEYFQIRKLSPISVFANLILRFIRGKRSPGELFLLVKKSINLIKNGGLGALRQKIFYEGINHYKYWVKSYDMLSIQDKKKIRIHLQELKYQPLITIIMPVYNTPEKWLREAIESVINQIYTNWELCIADDASTHSHIKQVLDEYKQKESRIKVIFRKENGHISNASNSALEICTGEFVGLMDHDDKLAEHALYMMVNELNNYPDSDLIYSDEDKIDENNERFDPYFKPDWNPELFNVQNYISHFCLYRNSILRKVNGLRIGFEGAQDWDLTMRVSEMIPASHIRHIPFILYHWRAIQGSTAKSQGEKEYVVNAQRNTIKSHFERMGKNVDIFQTKQGYWRIKYEIPNPMPLVSIIIPTKNQLMLLSQCIKSIMEKTLYPKYEIIIINNQSDIPDVLDFYNELKENKNIKVIEYNHSFNFSAINNFGVKFTKGEIIVFLNDDIEVISPDWLNELVTHSVRSEVGAVGAKLYYPNNQIQHAGVVLGLGGVAGHAYLNMPRTYPGQMSRALLTQNYSAVTAACLAIRKEIFIKVGGFNEENLRIAFNDIDFCIRVLNAGYQNIWTPYAELYHHESATRGYEDTTEKQMRFKSEIEYMKEKWKLLLENDPNYNLNLSLVHDSFSISFPPRIVKPWNKPFYTILTL